MLNVQQVQLLESAQHLGWLPDESLYSLASRHHRLSGNLRPAQTALQLFGHARGGYPHDLPAGLDYFATVLDQRLGDGPSLALGHTVLPLLLAFRSFTDRTDALAAMRSPRLGALKSRLGLPASGFGAACYLKACPACVREDTARFGTAYWHLSHQLPGAWFCLDHHEWLRVSSADRARQGRFDWTLPHPSDLVTVSGLGQNLPEPQQCFIQRLNQFILDASADANVQTRNGLTLAQALWAGMAANGWATRSGRLNRKIATHQLGRALQQLAVCPEWRDTNRAESACYSQIHTVLSDPARGHVLRPLTVAACLFETWSDFLREADSLPKTRDAPDALEANRLAAEDLRRKLVELVDNASSITAAAKRCDVSVSTAQAWVAAAGRIPPKRPSRIRDATLSGVLGELRRGADPSDVAARLDLSEASVRRVLRTTVGLRRQWRDARCAASSTEARARWTDALRISAVAGPKAARALEPKTYAWLYRNDREWLLQTNDRAKLPTGGNNSRVDWNVRDRAISEACQRAALGLYGKLNGGRIALIDVVKAVPELRTKVYQLVRLPLTARVIRSIVATRTPCDQTQFLTEHDADRQASTPDSPRETRQNEAPAAADGGVRAFEGRYPESSTSGATENAHERLRPERTSPMRELMMFEFDSGQS